MEELTLLEQINVIVSMVSLPLIIFAVIYMVRSLKVKDTKRKAKMLKNTVIFCLVISLLELITLDPIGCSIWIFNATLWVDSYFRMKLYNNLS